MNNKDTHLRAHLGLYKIEGHFGFQDYLLMYSNKYLHYNILIISFEDSMEEGQ